MENPREDSILFSIIYRSLPSWKQRIAGKSLPMEKFAIRKAERFLDQGNYLTLPSLELIYVWNGFRTLGKSWDLVDPAYVLVEKTIKEVQINKGKGVLNILIWAKFHFIEFIFKKLCMLTLINIFVPNLLTLRKSNPKFAHRNIFNGLFQIIIFLDNNKYYKDDICLLMLLKGMCLKHMNSPLQVLKHGDLN